MREHMPSDARVHYAVLDAGGIAPNVVQACQGAVPDPRSQLPELTRLIERVRKIADGAALMTETRVKAQVVSAVSNLMGNTPMEKAMHDNLLRLGPAAVRRGRSRVRREDPGDAERGGYRSLVSAAPACR